LTVSDSSIPIKGTGRQIDTTEVTTDAGVVDRQVCVVGDPSAADGLAEVSNNRLFVQTELAKSAFGDTITGRLKPIAAIKATYGLLDNTDTFTATGGSVAATDGMFVLQTGTSVGGYGVAWSRQPIVYQPGVGVECRGTVGFTTPVANSTQLWGLFSAVDGMFVGYNGTQFGVMHRYNGDFEVRKLTVTTASNANTTVTVTLNGVAYTASVTNSGVIATTAHEIEVGLNAGAAASLWYIQHVNNQVIFVRRGAGPFSGTYSATAGAGTFAGTIAQTKAGVTPTEEWVYQADWNGSTASWIDKTTVNLFRVSFAYLGFGPLKWEVFNPNTGQWLTIHTKQWGNNNTAPNFRNPSMRCGWAVASLGSTTNLTVRGANTATFLQGDRFDGRAFSAFGTVSSQAETQVLTVQVRREFGGRSCNAVLTPALLSFATDSTRGAIFRVYRNPTVAGTTNHQYVDENQSIALSDTAGTTVSGGRLLKTILVGPTGRTQISGSDLRTVFVAGDEMVITAQVAAGNAANLDAAVTWEEII